MELGSSWAVFGVGCAGGALVELVRWWRLARDPAIDRIRAGALYWVTTVLMILAGGGLATLYGVPLGAWLALNVGASAPALIGALSAQPPAPPASGDRPTAPPPTVREFLAFGRRAA